MSEEKKEKLQVNVDFTNFPELYADLMGMVEADGDTDRSKFIRNLVRQEKLRRAGQLPEQLPLPTPSITKKNRSATRIALPA